MVTPLLTEGDKNIFGLGAPLNFHLLNDYSGFNYIFFGNFTMFQPETVIWRMRTLQKILNSRFSTLDARVNFGLIQPEHLEPIIEMIKNFEIWVLVTSDSDKEQIQQSFKESKLEYKTQVFALPDIDKAIEGSTMS